jgi:trehalose synthase
VVQVSRWDRLKDMVGVLTAFVAGVGRGHLVLAGPDPAGVPDDPDQQQWFERCRRAWVALSGRDRARVTLLCLPMDDLVDNARLVNALQRSADVVVQKSLAEGFGLTVTEAMWKSRLLVAADVGGIRAQITDGVDGLLVDPTDLDAVAATLDRAVRGEVDGFELGRAAHRRVHENYLPDREIVRTADLVAS